MLKSLAFLVVLLTVGCTGGSSYDTSPDAAVVKQDAGPDPAALIGTWITQLSTTQLMRMKLDGANWEMDLLWQLTDGSYGMEMTQGTYTVAGDVATLRLKASTCQGVKAISNTSTAMTWTVDGSSLSVTMGTAYLVFQLKTTSPTGMGGAVLGCFADDATFTPHASQPVP